ncbi:hypothetical protein AgCh_033565 [Apium graveolens]
MQSVEVFDEIPNRRECLEIRHYYDVLDLIKISTTKLDIVAALAVHSLALKAGVIAHLLVKYSRAGNVGYSMTLFDQIVYKDMVVWNAMLTVSVENYCYAKAGMMLDTSYCNALINMYAKCFDDSWLSL